MVNEGDFIAAGLGAFGFNVIDDDVEHTVSSGYGWCALHVVSDSVIEDFTTTPGAPITGTITGATIKAGTWIFGEFLTLHLTSGDVWAYRKPLR
jgi:uncharacterized membrane protein YgdD (TMEM256/DUF423 family)